MKLDDAMTPVARASGLSNSIRDASGDSESQARLRSHRGRPDRQSSRPHRTVDRRDQRGGAADADLSAQISRLGRVGARLVETRPRCGAARGRLASTCGRNADFRPNAGGAVRAERQGARAGAIADVAISGPPSGKSRRMSTVRLKKSATPNLTKSHFLRLGQIADLSGSLRGHAPLLLTRIARVDSLVSQLIRDLEGELKLAVRQVTVCLDDG